MNEVEALKAIARTGFTLDEMIQGAISFSRLYNQIESENMNED